MAQASGFAGDGIAEGAARTSGGGGGFELNSVTPTAVRSHITVNAGGVQQPFADWLDPLTRRRSGLSLEFNPLGLAVAGAALVGALLLLRRR